jgi:hypothetical protein
MEELHQALGAAIASFNQPRSSLIFELSAILSKKFGTTLQD